MGILSAFYHTILLGRHGLYRYGIKAVRHLPRPVISVGNLTLGGTGKTPAVMAIAMEAVKRGIRPLILTRGYRGKAKGPCFVSKGHGPIIGSEEAGDEAYLMAGLLKDVSVVKGKDRYKAGIFALDELDTLTANRKSQIPDLFILDDGFQHWQLWRDVNILLIDYHRPFGNGRLFPEGQLREPLEAIERADVIVITKAEDLQQDKIAEIKEAIQRYNQRAPIFIETHMPVCLVKEGAELSLEAIKGERILAFAGIAEPESFKYLLTSIGGDVVRFKSYTDHHPYSKGDIGYIRQNAVDSGARWIITTEKDMARLKGMGVDADFTALRIGFSIDRGFYDLVFKCCG